LPKIQTKVIIDWCSLFLVLVSFETCTIGLIESNEMYRNVKKKKNPFVLWNGFRKPWYRVPKSQLLCFLCIYINLFDDWVLIVVDYFYNQVFSLFLAYWIHLYIMVRRQSRRRWKSVNLVDDILTGLGRCCIASNWLLKWNWVRTPILNWPVRIKTNVCVIIYNVC